MIDRREKIEEKINRNLDGKAGKDFILKARQNPWILSTIVLAVALLIVLIFRGGSTTGNVISENDVAQKLADFAEESGVDISNLKTEDMGSFYQVSFTLNGEEQVVYLTKDGEYIIQPLTSLTGEASANSETNTETQTPQEVPKTDKPKADAYIFSYCPYGLQFEKALILVYDLLKNKVDFNIIAIGAMHGEFEKTESLRQISIEKLYNKDKLFAYLKEFDTNTNIGSCSGDATCLDKYLPAIYTKFGIDKTNVENYMKTSAEAIYNTQMSQANSLKISGSPTFVINGVQVSVSRTPDAIKTAICDAFTTKPAECSTALSTSAFSAGFGGSAGTSTGASC